MEILRIENLSFKYPNSNASALKNVNLSIEEGEFAVLFGSSGCGKTTLLRLIKKELAPNGQKSGKIFCFGSSQDGMSDKNSAFDIGYVFQDPDSQIVTDKVWHELSFGLSNMGKTEDEIRLRIGETANYFGIQGWFRKNTFELSGGEKQMLALAGVMVTSPKILLLDEPTSQLDPIAASEFIMTLKKLNRETGVTVILAEHRLEDALPISDRAIFMEDGEVLENGSPKEVAKNMIESSRKMAIALPSAARLFGALGGKGEYPLSVREGKSFLSQKFAPCDNEMPVPAEKKTKPAVMLSKCCFRYRKDSEDVLKNTDMQVNEGEIFSLLGGNGAGKTTVLNVISGLKKPYSGKVEIFGKNIKSYKGDSLYRNNISLLPQDPKKVFIKDSVLNDFKFFASSLESGKETCQESVESVSEKLGISHLLNKHPYDLSGGEIQKCAIGKLLLSKPKIILMDEATKGLDKVFKAELADIMRELKKSGVTILCVTHDVEFAAEVSDRCALFFDGEVLAACETRKFFSQNNFYTTAVSRMSRSFFKETVTLSDLIETCTGRECQ